MAYIKRDIEDKIVSLSKEYSCLLITGPRQVGKTTVLKQLMNSGREYVRLDDLEEGGLAKRERRIPFAIQATESDRATGMQAFLAMRAEAKQNDIQDMPLTEINAEIAKARSGDDNA